eukprot:TRINITY_DN1324_c2_g1_i1.p2 TRINITY_DN1324_c2_g1~~TRINITY_DN1324_c2_g1_i1.p2  ORF type:complete len:50 (-),score=2.31 TRINITY_DN1324_c2_g1_i1:153-302(-)
MCVELCVIVHFFMACVLAYLTKISDIQPGPIQARYRNIPRIFLHFLHVE